MELLLRSGSFPGESPSALKTTALISSGHQHSYPPGFTQDITSFGAYKDSQDRLLLGTNFDSLHFFLRFNNVRTCPSLKSWYLMRT